uniref:Uncharacterized protein n=1 Tax=Kalanchoe fedtschenkoi TaxID=63787 RepID=A0A7N0VAS3_KALFE
MPLFGTFYDFLDRMKNPASIDLVRFIKRYILSSSRTVVFLTGLLNCTLGLFFCHPFVYGVLRDPISRFSYFETNRGDQCAFQYWDGLNYTEDILLILVLSSSYVLVFFLNTFWKNA